jgi:hypothetical protein
VPAFVGQQMDVFIETPEVPVAVTPDSPIAAAGGRQ